MVQPLRNCSKFLWVATVIAFTWLLIEGLHIFGVTFRTPVAYILVFLWGARIVVEFFSKGDMYMGGLLTLPAGGYGDLRRLFGMATGALLIFAAIYGYAVIYS